MVANVIWRFLELRGCVYLKNFLCFFVSIHVFTYAMSNPEYIVDTGTINLVFGAGSLSRPLVMFFFPCSPVNSVIRWADTSR